MDLLIFTKREFLLKEEKLIFLKNYYTMKIFKDIRRRKIPCRQMLYL